jgi:hypothetical protein
MEPHLQAILRLPSSFLADFDLLRAHSFNARVADVEGSISLPILVPGPGPSGEPRLGSPPLKGIREDVDWEQYFDDPWGGWGSVVQYHETQGINGPGAARVNGVVLRFPLSDDDASDPTQIAATLGRRLYESTGDWLRRLRAWIEVATGQDLDPTVVTPAVRADLNLFRVDSQGSAERIRDERPITVESIVERNYVGIATWQAVLYRVGLNEEPPTERLLLHDARMGLLRHHPRRAVLDAGTAAEIALSRMLDAELAGVPVAVGEMVRRQNRELGRLINALRALGIQLPDELQPKLAEPRNMAIHSGQEPDIAVARSAVTLAGEVVEQASPLKTLLGL